MLNLNKQAAAPENQQFAYTKTKTQISCAVTAQLISAFVFVTGIIQSLFFQNLKFQASSMLLSLYRPICVGSGHRNCYFPHAKAQFYL